MNCRLVIAFALVMAASAHASDANTVGRVTYAGTYGDGRLFVALDAQINEPGCVNTRFDIPAAHPQIKSWLAIALAAAASGKTVVVKTAGCLGAFPTMTQGTDSWFYMLPN